MYKRKVQTRSRSIIEGNELETLILRYLMRRAQKLFQQPDFHQNPAEILTLREILQEEYQNRPRLAARSRQMRICPLTGRSRGYYNWAKMSRIQFKQLAGAGLLPGIRKSSW